MRASDFDNSPYFTAADFGDQPESWVISTVSAETIGRDDPAKKLVLELCDSNGEVAERRLPLNKGNRDALRKAFGDDTDAWIGRPIRIHSVWVNFRGEQVRGIRVMPGAVAMRAAAAGGPAQASPRRVGAAPEQGGRSNGRTDRSSPKDDLDSDEILF